MHRNHLRQLLYSSGAIAVLGVLLTLFALDNVNTSMARADTAHDLCSSAVSAGGGSGLTATVGPALVDLERAHVESSRSTLALGLAGTLTPVLIFLNVLGFAGHYAPSEMDSKFRQVALEQDSNPDSSQLKLIH